MDRYNPATAHRVATGSYCIHCCEATADIYLDGNGYGLRTCPCGYDQFLTSVGVAMYSGDSYCYICDNNGTYHGPCLRCHRTRLGDTFVLDFFSNKGGTAK